MNHWVLKSFLVAKERITWSCVTFLLKWRLQLIQLAFTIWTLDWCSWQWFLIRATYWFLPRLQALCLGSKFPRAPFVTLSFHFDLFPTSFLSGIRGGGGRSVPLYLGFPYRQFFFPCLVPLSFSHSKLWWLITFRGWIINKQNISSLS